MRPELSRIQKFSREMRQMQLDLLDTAVVGVTGKTPVFDDPQAMEVLGEFKATVDDFRRILFFYVRNLSVQVGIDENQTLQAYRLQRATELLEVLSRPSGLSLTRSEQEKLMMSLDRIATRLPPRAS